MRSLLLLLICVLAGCEKDSSSDITPGNSAETKASIDTAAIDGVVANMPEGSEGSIYLLADWISDNYGSEPDKAYFIFRWIRENISPDFERAQQAYIGPGTQEAETVFSSKRAVCSGYAALFYRLALIAGLDARKVYGYGVMQAYDPQVSHSNYRHVWNAVEVNGGWYLVELSWIPDQALDGSSDVNLFFLTDPADFVRRHLPYDSEWQLLNPPIEEETFWASFNTEPQINAD